MRRPLAVLAAAALVAAAPWPATAAPLDALLSATPERDAPRALLEFGADRLTRSFDFSTADEEDLLVPGARDGNYRAVHLRGQWRVADGLWLQGGLWQRRLRGDVDHYRYGSWQLGGLWRFAEADGPQPALALRLSAWGSRARETVTTTPVRFPGAVLNSVTVSKPSDRQWQADLVATWPLGPRWELTAQLGAARIRLDYGALSATTTRNGCPYELSFTGNDIFGQLAGPCASSGGGVIRQFFDSSGEYGIDVANEIAWRGRFVQAGIGAAWRDGPWTLKAGLLAHVVERDAVDDILAARGDPRHRHNRVLMLDVGRQLTPRLAAFVRAQVGSNLFLDEIPVTYNSATSRNFGSRLSLLGVGLRASF